MIEGLALWALLVFLAVKLGMPWNKMTQGGSVVGGILWLVFVWVGMISWSPMDMTGGSIVQAPHIQLKPASSDITGEVESMHVKPNQKVSKGDPIYTVDTTVFKNKLLNIRNNIENAKADLNVANKNLDIAKKLSKNADLSIQSVYSEIKNKEIDIEYHEKSYKRLLTQNKKAKGTVSDNDLDVALAKMDFKKEELEALKIKLDLKNTEKEQSLVNITKEEINIQKMKDNIESLTNDEKLILWKINESTITAPTDGFLTNFILREGQFISMLPRINMYTEEKYVLVRINHQGIRNIKEGQYAEFATSVYPGKVFQAEVEAVIEATGESTGNILGMETSVTKTVVSNARNKHHFVRLKLIEPEGYDIPLGSSGIAWVSAEKPHPFLGFLDVIRGIIIRMKAQIFFVSSM